MNVSKILVTSVMMLTVFAMNAQQPSSAKPAVEANPSPAPYPVPAAAPADRTSISGQSNDAHAGQNSEMPAKE